jgi:hypothetical protein
MGVANNELVEGNLCFASPHGNAKDLRGDFVDTGFHIRSPQHMGTITGVYTMTGVGLPSCRRMRRKAY